MIEGERPVVSASEMARSGLGIYPRQEVVVGVFPSELEETLRIGGRQTIVLPVSLEIRDDSLRRALGGRVNARILDFRSFSQRARSGTKDGSVLALENIVDMLKKNPETNVLFVAPRIDLECLRGFLSALPKKLKQELKGHAGTPSIFYWGLEPNTADNFQRLMTDVKESWGKEPEVRAKGTTTWIRIDAEPKPKERPRD